MNRAGQISVIPTEIEISLNATSESLYLQSFVNISEDANLEIETTWKLALNDNWTVVVSTDSWLSLGPFECEGPLLGYLAEICIHNGSTPVYEVTVFISDGYEIITHTWSVQYTVWHPPEPEPEPQPTPTPTPEPEPEEKEGDGNSSTSGDSAMGMDTRVIIGLTAIVIVLAIIVLITGRKQAPPPPCDLHQQVFHKWWVRISVAESGFYEHGYSIASAEAQGHDSLAATRAP